MLGAQLSPGPFDLPRIRAALDAGGPVFDTAVSPWSDLWTFRIGSPPNRAPGLLGPPNGARISGGRLTWSAVDLAEFYEHEITASPGTEGFLGWSEQGELRSRELRDDRISPGVYGGPLANGQTYYWRVRGAAGSDLCAGPWSGWSSFVWIGPSQGLGALGGPTCVEVPGVTCEPPTPAPPTPSRTPRASRTPTPTRTATGTVVVTPSATPTSPPAATKTPVPPTDPPKPLDKDGDGYSPDVAPKDCNDNDASINPGAKETTGDQIDSNCNGDIDT